ncbi:MAG: DUF262 domain-containing protein [Clostridia bacterium]|nr:DUF262 domain-containing protein [Clostridia bacterium]
MNDTIVKLKTVADLQTESAKFFIDAYQRGYRWTENEVRDLLDDIREFSHVKRPDDGTFYCLQPIIVTKAEDGVSWKVIDGQQRLTTLFLIYSFYWIAESPFMRGNLPFSLSYSNKPKLQECLLQFTEKSYSSSETVEREMAGYESDIDCYYVLEAYKSICDFFQKLVRDPNTKNEITDMKKIFDTNMKIIWYEITNCDVSMEVSIFSKINMGKIALTNAELIKALLLKSDGNDSEILASTQMNIAVKWDEIEAQLSEEDFWSFLVNEKREDTSYATRIDFIFHVMARELNEGILSEANKAYPNEESYTVSESVNRDKFSFYVFSNYMRLLQRHPDVYQTEGQNYVENIWDGICEYYRMFKDWYRNVSWYHMIGFLVETSSKNYIDQILELSRLYRKDSEKSGEGHKEHFENELRRAIILEVFEADAVDKEKCLEFIAALDYAKKPEDIRKTLLLYNIAYLESCEENGRFPFEKYKDEKVFWDLEHINAVADTRPDDDRRDSEDNPRLQWLQKALSIPDIEKIKTVDGREVQLLIQSIITNKYYLSKYQPNTRDFTQVYDAVISYFSETSETDNSIGNLTLLDGGTNRSYKNDVFPLKRRTILKKTMSDVFIPLCTRKVFMKGFAESGDLLKWRVPDKKAYINDIHECICKYLRLEEKSHES